MRVNLTSNSQDALVMSQCRESNPQCFNERLQSPCNPKKEKVKSNYFIVRPKVDQRAGYT